MEENGGNLEVGRRESGGVSIELQLVTVAIDIGRERKASHSF